MGPGLTGMFRTAAADRQAPFDAAVVIPTTLRPSLDRAVRSVFAQDFPGRVQILLGIDVALHADDMLPALLADCPPRMAVTVCALPYSTSVRHGGLYPNRFSGALRTILTYAAHARRVAYLDDDNWWAPGHLTSLAAAIEGVHWAFSQRVFADPVTAEPICLDDWESVGPGIGIFADTFGGFVDPSSLMIDKLDCHEVPPLWSLAAFPNGTGEDRLVFSALADRHAYRPTGQATSFYSISETDPNHAARVQHMRERGVVLPSERRSGVQSLATAVAGLPRGATAAEPGPVPDRLLTELMSRLKPREIVALACVDGTAPAALARVASALGLDALVVAEGDGASDHAALVGQLGTAGIVLPGTAGAGARWLAERRVAVDLVHLEQAGTWEAVALPWSLLRTGGFLIGPGGAPDAVTAFAREIGTELLPAELDGARYWLLQKG